MSPNNRTAILKAAEELISELGIKAATISKVAGKARVADSLVYKYFANKEDLLFSVARERMKEAGDELREQLQGLRDPESRLRKLVWHSLRYNDRRPDYVRILLFECRSNERFYRSPAYDIMREHAKITGEILDQGVEAGVFRSDIDMRLVREIIYGAFDFEAISCFAVNEIDSSAGDFDAIMDFLLTIVLKKTDNSEPGVEERILMAAESVVAERGSLKATVSEIAARAGVSEGAIYEYFKSKEELIMTVAETRFKKHLVKLPDVFNIMDCKRRLRRLMRYHFTLYLPNRDFLKIFLFDIQLNYDYYSSRAFAVFREYISELEKVMDEGIKSGVFRKNISPRIFRNIFLGAFSHMALRWLVFEDKYVDKVTEIDRLVAYLSNAILVEQK